VQARPLWYDAMLGEPLRARSAHIMTLGAIPVTGSRDELDASPLDTNHASEKRRHGTLNREHGTLMRLAEHEGEGHNEELFTEVVVDV
jgi:hypothetical protein